MNTAVVISAKDNVATALESLAARAPGGGGAAHVTKGDNKPPGHQV